MYKFNSGFWLKLAATVLTVLPGAATASLADEYMAQDKVALAMAADGSSEESNLASPELQAAVKIFKAQPTELGWLKVAESLKALLKQPAANRVDGRALIKSNPALTELGVKTINGGSAKVWFFPSISQNHEVFVQWREVRAAVSPPGRHRHRKRPAPPIVISHLSTFSTAGNIVVRDARVIEADHERFLILAGGDSAQNAMWLKSYKLGTDGLKENNAPLTSIPPFLLHHASGKIGFDGSDLVINVHPVSKPAAEGAGKNTLEPQWPSYKIALHLVGGRYVLDGKVVPDTPYNAVFQFFQALEQGRLDLAKAWLLDPSLVSIPRYLGFTTRGEAGGFRAVSLAGAPGLYRFRVITFEKNDLILDVVKAKTQWAIKSIFIAPADPVWRKIAGGMPPMNPDSKAADNKTSESATSEELEPTKSGGALESQTPPTPETPSTSPTPGEAK